MLAGTPAGTKAARPTASAPSTHRTRQSGGATSGGGAPPSNFDGSSVDAGIANMPPQPMAGSAPAIAPDAGRSDTPPATRSAEAPAQRGGPDASGLLPPDALGLKLPPGFRARIVGRTGQSPVDRSTYLWHGAPDGGATFALDDGGYVYVSNAELGGGLGGVGALRFDRHGRLFDAYRILDGTTRNCAGGATPWGTWISCEEHATGHCFECDPRGEKAAVVRPALGVFTHEALAVDIARGHVYLTEDQFDGRLYRFSSASQLADGSLDLDDGVLEVLELVDPDSGQTRWRELSDPSGQSAPTRLQVPESQAFAGGEGIVFHRGRVYFATKLDDRIWALDAESGLLSVLYDRASADNPILSGVDNIAVTPGNDIVVAEDPGDLQLVQLDPSGTPRVLLQVTDQPGSELAGPAFDPSGRRLYFSSQRGLPDGGGITYEVEGPFDRLASDRG